MARPSGSRCPYVVTSAASALPGEALTPTLAHDDEQLAATLAGLHFLAFACLMLHPLSYLTSTPYHAPGTPAELAGQRHHEHHLHQPGGRQQDEHIRLLDLLRYTLIN
jgi:hypothetical protein